MTAELLDRLQQPILRGLLSSVSSLVFLLCGRHLGSGYVVSASTPPNPNQLRQLLPLLSVRSLYLFCTGLEHRYLLQMVFHPTFLSWSCLGTLYLDLNMAVLNKSNELKELTQLSRLRSLTIVNGACQKESLQDVISLPLTHLNLGEIAVVGVARAGGRRQQKAWTSELKNITDTWLTLSVPSEMQPPFTLTDRLLQAHLAQQQQKGDNSASATSLTELRCFCPLSSTQLRDIMTLSSLAVLDIADCDLTVDLSFLYSHPPPHSAFQPLSQSPHLQFVPLLPRLHSTSLPRRLPDPIQADPTKLSQYTASCRNLLAAYHLQMRNLEFGVGQDVLAVVEQALTCTELRVLKVYAQPAGGDDETIDQQVARLSSASTLSATATVGQLPHLHTLTLSGASTTSDDLSLLECLFAACPELQDCELVDVRGLSVTVLPLIADRCRQLRRLQLILSSDDSDSNSVEPTVLAGRMSKERIAATSFPCLTTFSVKGYALDGSDQSPQLQSVLSLLQTAPRLRNLHLDALPALSLAQVLMFRPLTSLMAWSTPWQRQDQRQQFDPFFRYTKAQTGVDTARISRLRVWEADPCRALSRKSCCEEVVQPHEMDLIFQAEQPEVLTFTQQIDGTSGREAFFNAVQAVLENSSNSHQPETNDTRAAKRGKTTPRQ